jgi:hypothetical protein
MLISTALLLDSNIRNSVCTPAKLPCRRVVEGNQKISKVSIIQRVTEISRLILTGNRTRQKEQRFYLPFCRKTMFNSKKKLERFFTKITLRH